jgi:hypothetical protein
VIRGEPVTVRGRPRPIELLFNLKHPDELAVVTEVNENDDDDDLIEEEVDSTEDELQRRFDKMTFVIATRKLQQLPHWIKVSEVFKTDSDAAFLKRAGVIGHQRDYQITPEESDHLRFWALIANAKGRYSRGSTETFLDQDLTTLKLGGGVPELIDRLRLQVGRLDITPAELEGRNQRSALFKSMFLAFRAAGAKDWRSNLAIALDHSGTQHRLQFHHIFPKAVLKSTYATREADDIANLAFIGGTMNRAISDKAPADYFPPLIAKIGHASFTAQCIPIASTLLQVETYKAFLAQRRAMIAERLHTFLGTQS